MMVMSAVFGSTLCYKMVSRDFSGNIRLPCAKSGCIYQFQCNCQITYIGRMESQLGTQALVDISVGKAVKGIQF